MRDISRLLQIELSEGEFSDKEISNTSILDSFDSASLNLDVEKKFPPPFVRYSHKREKINKQQWIADKIDRFQHLTCERLHFYFYGESLGCPVGDIYFDGNENEVKYDLAEVLRIALLRSAKIIVMGHNHPVSRRAYPSPQDTCETKRAIAACRLIGLRLHDHFIVGGEEYFSMRDAGLM